ncbi:hypothetical protein P3W45_000217 [Vairimorpha bombi]|jgi:uncharacterized UPF0160 family protein
MKLVTHNGRFHYDELLASAILTKIYPESTIIRTRDSKVISTGDIVYDVGGVYDPSRNLYDHHQPTFTETYSSDYNIKLSSAGLVYKHFHESFLSLYNIHPTGTLYKKLTKKIYKEFFLGADAQDNGYNIYGEIKPRTIYAMISLYNSEDNLISDQQNENFRKALTIVSKDLDLYINHVITSWYNKYKELEILINQTDDYILVSDVYYSYDLILEIEKENNKNILFLVYPSDDLYKIRAINTDTTNFSLKCPLKKEWRGRRGDELNSMIKGAGFVHSSGFIGTNKTKEGAIKMCRESYNSRE